MVSLKQVIERIPGLAFAYRLVHFKYGSLVLPGKTPEAIFTEIFEGNKWRGEGSVSGPGSDLNGTDAIRSELPNICEELDISTILDIPCGDFHWMRHVDLEGIDYTGADIVAELIQENRKFKGPGIRFSKINLIEDELPTADLVLCRDCLVHLSLRDATLALSNICRSKSKYLLTTTFTARRRNRDIATGQWYPINLELPPFCFRPPLKATDEKCAEGRGIYADKTLGLWRIADVKESLKESPGKLQAAVEASHQSALTCNPGSDDHGE